MSAYLAAVLADSPVHYWRCADPGGRLLHNIGSSSVPLTVVGNGSPGYSGPISDGGAVDLVLDGEYANTGLPITVATGLMTLECLCWLDNLIVGNHYLVLVNSATLCALLHTGTQWSTYYNGSQQIAAVGITGQAWQHVVMTYDGVNQNLYLNGSFVRNQAVAPQAAGPNIFEVCTFAGASNFGDAFMSEIAVYSTALSAGRIAAHFAAIDQVGNIPLWSGAGGLQGGGGAGTSYNGILQEILNSVKHLY